MWPRQWLLGLPSLGNLKRKLSVKIIGKDLTRFYRNYRTWTVSQISESTLTYYKFIKAPKKPTCDLRIVTPRDHCLTLYITRPIPVNTESHLYYYRSTVGNNHQIIQIMKLHDISTIYFAFSLNITVNIWLN